MDTVDRLYPIASGRTGVRVVVVGDKNTGKSTLIDTLYSKEFKDSVAPVLPPTLLTAEQYPDLVEITIIDTSSSSEDQSSVDEELINADSILLIYACDEFETFENIKSIWLPRLQTLEVNVPVIIVGCKSDLQGEQRSLIKEEELILKQYPHVQNFMSCSALDKNGLEEVFYRAQIIVLYPLAPLIDKKTSVLKPQCESVLKRIFREYDKDEDGVLNNVELSDFQVQCFGYPLHLQDFNNISDYLQLSEMDRGYAMVNVHGVNLEGFLFIMSTAFIERPETIWTVLRKSGYNDDLELPHNS